jgi:hypothetical protein
MTPTDCVAPPAVQASPHPGRLSGVVSVRARSVHEFGQLRRKNRQVRPDHEFTSAIGISLRPEALRLVADWVHEYERFWNEKLDEFQRYFKQQKRNKQK